MSNTSTGWVSSEPVTKYSELKTGWIPEPEEKPSILSRLPGFDPVRPARLLGY